MNEESPKEIGADVAKKIIPLQFKRSDKFALVFANSVQLSPGQKGEVQLFFGQVIAPPSGVEMQALEVQQILGVAMTLEEAKNLLEILKTHIPVYETVFAKDQVEESE